MSDKNHNNDNKRPKKSLYNILDKEGFYIILFLCVCIVAVTAIWVSNQEPDYILTEDMPRFEEQPDITLVEEGEDTNLDEPSESAMLPNTQTTSEIGNNQQSLSETGQAIGQSQSLQTDEANTDMEDDTEDAMIVSSEQRANMIMPVIGRKGLPFADDRLVFHQTLEQWSTHKGIDIHAEEGSPVRAALEGEVIEVINDTIMGITITLQHNEDLLTRYCNLSTDAMVKVGVTVEKGQIISGVGRTASTKSVEGPLLHFQVIENGNNVDPQNYLPKFNN
ncbi:M23 family metallopeptidase [Alkaliphilus peptidifermentans]|uniref:Peptidase family M23 n=1 Tax=Alkaliphilus peptidifermentans DSM 18978 TaxID=1120976 RepID=A0A1G5JH57_9FIRM|nr:M23 family metallopeptidase [Alkaliphilus peptidifermentans]SCY87251.1 Peptidase family M23 [Alkaliphilus peptidifermentans DSM 18978]